MAPPARAAAMAAAAALLLLATGAGAFSSTPIFQAYRGFPPCFRQPVLVFPGAGNVLAIVEGRNNSYCSGADDGNNSTIVSKTSRDGGVTWSALSYIYVRRGVDFLSAVYDAVTDTTHLLLQVNGSQTVHLASPDAGASWSAPATVTVAKPANVTVAFPAVGHGIQLTDALCPASTCGAASGRLVVPFVCKKATGGGAARGGDVACPGCFSCLLLSDDHGASWRVGAVSDQDGTREPGLAQLQSAAVGAAGAAIYASERNMGAEPGSRLHSLSLDGGASFASSGADPTLPDGDTKNWTGIVAGVARFDTGAPAPAAKRVVLSTPASRVSRSDLALFVSADEAQTWSAGAVISPGPAGYSDLGQLNATHLAVLYENGPQEFSQQISFGLIAVADLPPTL